MNASKSQVTCVRLPRRMRRARSHGVMPTVTFTNMLLSLPDVQTKMFITLSGRPTGRKPGREMVIKPSQNGYQPTDDESKNGYQALDDESKNGYKPSMKKHKMVTENSITKTKRGYPGYQKKNTGVRHFRSISLFTTCGMQATRID